MLRLHVPVEYSDSPAAAKKTTGAILSNHQEERPRGTKFHHAARLRYSSLPYRSDTTSTPAARVAPRSDAILITFF